MVKPPNKPCLHCGTVHWSTQPCPGTKSSTSGPEISRRYAEAPVTKSVTKPAVTKSASVTKSTQHSVTKAPSRVTLLEAEVERLLDEIKVLKRELAKRPAVPSIDVSAAGKDKRPGRRPLGLKAMTAAERARKTRKKRAKEKAAKDGVQQFEG